MKFIFTILFLFLLTNCSKPKTVLICGDHVCVNKIEAKQYFEENLILEVKIINKKIKDEFNLVELNLKENQNGEKEIKIFPKKTTSKNLKILTDEEVIKIKKSIKKKKLEKNNKKVSKINIKKNKSKTKNNAIKTKIVNKTQNNIVDVCTILEKCSIDEISKHLIKEGKSKDFPDITKRE